MAFNGSGLFSRLYSWVSERNLGNKIDSAKMDAEMDGMAVALSNMICKDGQSQPTAAIPFNGQKITGLGDAAAAQDALNRRTGDSRYIQVLGGTITPISVVASTVFCATGNWFYKTAAGNLTWVFDSPPVTGGFGFILEITNGGLGTQTWPASVKWQYNVDPDLSANGKDYLVFITRDGGTRWDGFVCGQDMS